LEYVEAGRVEELPAGKGTVFTVANKQLAIFNVDGTFYAMDDACLHQGLSLGTSRLDGKIVTCRGHGWRYDVTTGCTLHVSGYGVTTYPVKVIDGKICVAIGFPRINSGPV
jgi:3-phenylpropionate/trans-cinnamate dioxygenase ferredoxin subunit